MRSMTSAPIDLDYRPDSYFWPLGAERELLTHIKGAARREALQQLVDQGKGAQIPEFLSKATLSEEERAAIGRIHPYFMGGEYLPDQEEGEVEIARIEIDSTTADVTSVYASLTGSGIHYRVVDEYGGGTLSGPSEMDSSVPLTLGELEGFFTEAWPFMEVLEMNFEDDTEGMLGFFRAYSQFYPQLDALLRQRVVEAYPGD